ncbi:MAG: Rrf2 family transcriptional regulator [Kiritimatiellae bacterium]|nr:Rrf2 family transcriptional regulator [Kiritimatiellia bacterium]
MKLTTRSEYALLALIYLARHEADGFIPVDRIAEARAISPRFLEQILLALKHARYLRSLKGQHGGYQLARRPEEITLADVIRVLDGALAPTESVSKYFYEATPIESEKGLVRVFRDIRDYVAEKLEHTTLAEVAGTKRRNK